MPQPIFIFKVALSDRKSIWRKIAIKANQTLDDLHEVIFDAFDRDDEHLYSFFIPKKSGKMTIQKIYDESVEYTSPNTLKFGGDDCHKDAAKAKISSLKLKKKQVFYYLFDFGDEWWHEITVEDTEAKTENDKYPRVVEQKGESPPQYVYDDDDEEYEDEEVEEE
jgi:hypothetical protein